MDAIDTLAADLVERKPEPSSAAPAMLAAAGGETSPAAGLDDVPFDPAIHETGPDGRGIPRAGGGGWKLKRGRGAARRKAPRIMATAPPADFLAAGATPASSTTAPIAGDVEPIEVKAKRCAKDTADTIFETAVAFLSDEWAPEPAERERIERALERVYVRYGCLDLPPGIALVLAFGMYAAKRQATALLIAPLIAKLFGAGGAPGVELTAGLSNPGALRNAA